MHGTHGLTDLNLLVTLHHLLATGSVTATAARLQRSQPAVSRALGRLRTALSDPLLVRVGARLMPTARASALQPELEALLSRLDDVLTSGASFDPATARRTFVVATSDYGAAVVMRPLLNRLPSEAPGLSIRVVPHTATADIDLSSGAWDLLWAPQRPLGQGIVWSKLVDEGFAFVVRRGHPLASKPLTIERYLSIPQIALSPEGRPGNPLDEALARLGHRRRVVAHVPTFSVVPSLVAQTDLGAVLPRRIIELNAHLWRLQARPLPFSIPGFSVHQAWHERHRHDAGHAWFRQRVVQLCRER